MKVRISLIASLSVLFVHTRVAGQLEAASTIRVPADQPTIQSAIAAASTGDTIQVDGGTYVENLNFSGKAITVTSVQGPAVTIIDGNQSGPVVTFASGEGFQSVLSGFTLRNGNATTPIAQGGGISIGNSSPTITGNIIVNNNAANGGGGIAISGGSPLIQGNLIKNNGQTNGYSGGVGGGGIAIVGASSARILNNTVSSNSWYSSSGGGIALFAAGTPTIANNVISNNTAYSQGGGFYIVNQSDASIVQNVIVGNSAATGGGLYWFVPSGGRGPILINNTIYGNPSPQGSGVFTDGFDAQAEMLNNIIVAVSGQTPVTCGNFTTNVPIFLTNDVVSDTGLAYGGMCGSQTGSNGNISADPLFVNASAGDFHLQGGSPAIDTATNTTIAPAQDFDGITRPQDGNGDGAAIMDMGIYEFRLPDLTPPMTVAGESPAAGPSGWNMTSVSVTLSATDNPGGSGVQNVRYSLSGAQVSPLVVAGNPANFAITAEGTTTVSYAASDLAGNVEATKSLTINIDQIAPATVAGITPSANTAGWNAANVTVTLNSTDNPGGSGVQSIRYWLNGNQSNSVFVKGNSATFAITGEGVTTVSYAGSDVAGNVEATKTLTVNIDKTSPTTVASETPSANAAGWNTSNVTVSLNSTDNAGGSGVQGIRYWLNGNQLNSVFVNGNSATFAITAEGTTTVSYAGSDVAGNVEATKSLTVNIDKTAPVTVASATPSANAAGWNTSNVTVSLSSTDNAGGSGVQSIRYWLNGSQGSAIQVTGNSATVVLTAEGATTLNYAVVDNAGNVESVKSVTINIDKTVPAISGMPAPGCAISPANNKLVLVASVTASDSLSGLMSLSVTASSNPPASPGDIVISGGTVQLRAVRGRIYTVVATGIDVAGNSTLATATCTVSK